MQAKLDGAILIETFGVRVFGTDHQTSQLTLNGQVSKVGVGWNRHTKWPETTASSTTEQFDADVMVLVRDGGANFVRAVWLDRLDEME